MKTIVNRTRRPIQVHLPQGKVLHLGPAKTGQIADDAIERDSVRRLLDAGEIAVVGEEELPGSGTGDQGAQQEATHGFHQNMIVHHRGNR